MALFASKVTVDGVLEAFNKSITDLAAIANTNTEARLKNEQKISELALENASLEAETSRAIAVADKLRNLISI